MTQVVTVGSLVNEAEAAYRRMSVKNSHRSLIARMAHALIQLAERAEPRHIQPPIVVEEPVDAAV